MLRLLFFSLVLQSAISVYKNPVCNVQEDFNGWSQTSVCDSEPQFLSAFCQHEHTGVQQLNGESVYALQLNDKECPYFQSYLKPCMEQRKLYSGQLISPNTVGFGMVNLTIQAAKGQSVRTTLSVYGPQTSFGITFEGSEGKSVDFGGGGQYKTVPLDFDATEGFHSYAWNWTSSAITFYVDGQEVWSVTSNVPTQAAEMIMNIYPCGASYCPKYTGAVNVASYVKSLAVTPMGTQPVDCKPANWVQTWSEDFSGTSLGKEWTAFNNCTHGSTERELYVPEGVSVADGMLTLTAFEKNLVGPKGHPYTIASGWVDTSTNYSYCHGHNPNGFAQLYGKWEVNARIPIGEFWPAIWFMNDNAACWPTAGELDLMEPALWSGPPPYTVRSTFHFGYACNDNHGLGIENPVCADGTNCTFSKDFTTYTMIWTENSLQWYVGGFHVGTVTNTLVNFTIPTVAHYLILNNAVQQNQYPDKKGQMPGKFDIDWIKAYKDSR